MNLQWQSINVPFILDDFKINHLKMTVFSRSCLLCDAFPISYPLKDEGRCAMMSWYVIRALLVLYSRSCRDLEDSSPCPTTDLAPPAALGNSTNPSLFYCNCWPQRCLRNNAVNAHKVACIFVSTCLYQYPYVLQRQHLCVVLCKLKSSLKEY